MSERHHIVIGNGIAGSSAAATLRGREPDSRITIVTLSSLLFYNRYDLPQVFKGRTDWRDFLVFPPDYYGDNRISVRRNSRVAGVDTLKRTVSLLHQEDLHYDSLLVATGGRGHMPAELVEYLPLMHGFATFEEAMRVARELPEGGHVVMLGGDMIGLDLARTLVACGYRVTLIADEHCFWPHRIGAEERPKFIEALSSLGVSVVEGVVSAVAHGAKGLPGRKVTLRNGTEVMGDVVMPFFGLVPSIEFIAGGSVDIERGLLVSPQLKTTDESIWAAGDVCQIWSKEENGYCFFHGWRNVRAMGELAARNMTGGNDAFATTQDENLRIDQDGRLSSPLWEYN
jgi:NAD(P)H-nitrite reductase large subunit